jgi:pimeloyl-ACP methyl ester carboxylesterase
VKRLGLILFGLASAALADSPKPSVVLVHGAFADGSSWAKVIPILQAKGYNVTAVQNPLASFADDVAATNRAIAAQTGPVILVGHSWGGVVIMEAGVDPKVVGLVYVAAFGPDSTEVVGDIGVVRPWPAWPLAGWAGSGSLTGRPAGAAFLDGDRLEDLRPKIQPRLSICIVMV